MIILDSMKALTSRWLPAFVRSHCGRLPHGPSPSVLSAPRPAFGGAFGARSTGHRIPERVDVEALPAPTSEHRSPDA